MHAAAGRLTGSCAGPPWSPSVCKRVHHAQGDQLPHAAGALAIRRDDETDRAIVRRQVRAVAPPGDERARRAELGDHLRAREHGLETVRARRDHDAAPTGMAFGRRAIAPARTAFETEVR